MRKLIPEGDVDDVALGVGCHGLDETRLARTRGAKKKKAKLVGVAWCETK